MVMEHRWFSCSLFVARCSWDGMEHWWRR